MQHWKIFSDQELVVFSQVLKAFRRRVLVGGMRASAPTFKPQFLDCISPIFKHWLPGWSPLWGHITIGWCSWSPICGHSNWMRGYWSWGMSCQQSSCWHCHSSPSHHPHGHTISSWWWNRSRVHGCWHAIRLHNCGMVNYVGWCCI